MIFTRDDKTQKVLARIPGSQGDDVYECTLEICSNPLCICNVITIQFTPYPPSPEPALDKSITVDIRKRRVEIGPLTAADTSKKDKDFLWAVSAHIQDDDYQFLHQEYYLYKHAVTNRADISSLYAEFPIDDIEQNGDMIGYTEILPYGDYFALILDEQQYILVDLYCVRLECACVDTVMACILVNEQKQTGEEVAAYRIDYKKRRWETLDAQDNIPGVVGDLETLKQTIEGAYPKFYRRLRERHQQLKTLYMNCLKEHELYPPQHASRRVSGKVGRNDPFPWGSGKKFKQCCMTKAR